MEDYVKNTLPNEWVPSWGADALKAGAVIIRSGMYWRINRTDLESKYPNNNCDGGIFCFDYDCQYSTKYNITAPTSRGGKEEWRPNTALASTNAAVDATFQYHAETRVLKTGIDDKLRPDKLIALRYNSTIQNRTNQTTGTWQNRIWYAYTGSGHPGSPYNPNAQCSQTDTWTPTSDPVFPNS
jgi:peptidoglycan hydrolase-like amidase